MSQTVSTPADSFFLRHEFAIRRLHSLTGLVPLGLYMVVHLTTNSSLLNGTATFQRAVFMIHSLGSALPLVEWGAIFLPLLFHAGIGIWISKTGGSNVSHYPLSGNRRYWWQRATGLFAVVYLFFHILHLHGGVHFEPYLEMIRPLGFGAFRPYNAASTLGAAMQGFVWPAFYLLGMLSLVYHLSNGIWTAGITWGLWISPAAQQRATKVCAAFGIGLAVIGTSAWWAAVSMDETDIQLAREVEDEMFEAALQSGVAYDMPDKRSEAEAEPEESQPFAEAKDDGQIYVIETD